MRIAARLLPLLALLPITIHARGLSAVCGELEGAKVVSNGSAAIVGKDKQIGPMLIVDSAKPRVLTSVWKATHFGKETVDRYEGVVIEFDDDRVHAIEKDQFGLTSYSLFLATGLLYYTNLRYGSLLSSEPSLLAFVSKCQVQVRP